MTAVVNNQAVDCYENGVAVTQHQSGLLNWTWEYSRNGAVCLSGRIPDLQAVPYFEYLSDQSGALQITIQLWPSNDRMRIECGGQVFDVDANASSCALSMPTLQTCTRGVCP
jgi:hypothetical protein